ncbi:hypothetical protein KIN20_002561 [Parelaphostrongylus tenuis]|uniref:Uncharacterized protein n=1 Tax=Parelaphostrongylus tenuis TaxID=148309 RepID=A0AAD5LXY6_PARTN|nr:hypothetical protein KIN20_002561 [Parelaphostrongylus tenuis]
MGGVLATCKMSEKRLGLPLNHPERVYWSAFEVARRCISLPLRRTDVLDTVLILPGVAELIVLSSFVTSGKGVGLSLRLPKRV